MAKGRILVVESARPVIAAVPPALEGAGYRVQVVGSAARALADLAEAEYELVLTSLAPPDMDGPSLLAAIKAGRSAPAVVVLASEGERAAAFALVTAGAEGFLEVPHDLSPEKVLMAVGTALERRRLLAELARARGAPALLNLEALERQAIVRALEATRWNKQAAAKLLGLHRPTLYAKLQKHGIPKMRPA